MSLSNESSCAARYASAIQMQRYLAGNTAVHKRSRLGMSNHSRLDEDTSASQTSCVAE